MNRLISSVASFLGFGTSSSASSSTSYSSGSATGTTWSSGPLPSGERERHPDAATYRNGRREFTPDPYTGGGDHVVRNFGEPNWPGAPDGTR
jgi:hypothetical protein